MISISYLKEQARRLRDFARAEQVSAVRERLFALAEECDSLARAVERARGSRAVQEERESG
jgi:hypothetical protein